MGSGGINVEARVNVKSIIFSIEMVKAILEGRRSSNKRIYLKKGEDSLCPNHLFNRLINGTTLNNKTGCWEWQKSKNNHGYGTLTVNRKRVYAHRLSYTLFVGEILDGSYVLHECDNPCCINPEHLHIGTQSLNMKECYGRGRSKIKPLSLPGEKNGQAKLKISDVELIRLQLAQGVTQAIIAKRFGVSQSQISNIKRGLQWNEANYIFKIDDKGNN